MGASGGLLLQKIKLSILGTKDKKLKELNEKNMPKPSERKGKKRARHLDAPTADDLEQKGRLSSEHVGEEEQAPKSRPGKKRLRKEASIGNGEPSSVGGSRLPATADTAESQILDDPGALLREMGEHIDTRMTGRFEITEDELDSVAAEGEGSDEEVKAETLRKEAFAARNKFVAVADSVQVGPQPAFVGHNRYSVTCVAVYSDYMFLGDKSGAVYRHTITTNDRIAMEPRHKKAVLCIAVSDTRKSDSAGVKSQRSIMERSSVDTSVQSFVVSGGEDGAIHVWKSDDCAFVGTFDKHRGPVTGAIFRKMTATLYTTSNDMCVRVWSVAEMAPVDRLFGHKGPINAIYALFDERCATVGNDRTLRYMKIDSAKQVEYAPSSAILESVTMLNEQTVVTGNACGTIAVFDVMKRQPLCQREFAHGYCQKGDGTGLEREMVNLPKEPDTNNASRNAGGEGVLPCFGNPVLSLAAPPFSNMVASGSNDGFVRLWKYVSRGGATLNEMVRIPQEGFINCLAFAPECDFLCAVVAKEPRFGRWVTLSKTLNGIAVIRLALNAAQRESNNDESKGGSAREGGADGPLQLLEEDALLEDEAPSTAKAPASVERKKSLKTKRKGSKKH